MQTFGNGGQRRQYLLVVGTIFIGMQGSHHDGKGQVGVIPNLLGGGQSSRDGANGRGHAVLGA
jgi:hypothetical protein